MDFMMLDSCKIVKLYNTLTTQEKKPSAKGFAPETLKKQLLLLLKKKKKKVCLL